MFDPSKLNLDLNDLDKKEDASLNNSLNEENSSFDNKKDIFLDEDSKKQEKGDILENSKKLKEEKKEKSNIDNKQKGDILSDDSLKKGDLEIDKGKLQDTKKEEKIIFDINFNTLNDFVKYLVINKYDFFTLVPEDDKVVISFRKDGLEKEQKFIKYPTYLKVLLKAKQVGKLIVEETDKAQENKASFIYNGKAYEILVKTTPSTLGEKLFFKMKEIPKKLKKKKQKMSVGKMLGIFAGMLFVVMVLGGAFMAIVIFKSNSVADLQFFNNLGVDTNAVKEFAAKLVNWIFGSIILIEVILLFIFSYKALLTKKQFKQKKVSRIILSIFFLVLTIVTFVAWMYLNKKIQDLKGLNYGKIEFYDNEKFKSSLFKGDSQKIDITRGLIGPVSIRFDDKEFIQKLIDDGFKPKKVIWEIGKTRVEKSANENYFIHKFDKKGVYTVKLVVDGFNIKGEPAQKQKEISNIDIEHIIKIKEIALKNGGKKFMFDATDLKDLGKIYWYYIPSLKGKSDNEKNNIISKALAKEKLIKYTFYSKNIFEGEEYYAMKIISGDLEDEDKIKEHPLDKIFIVGMGEKDEIYGEIEPKRDIEEYNRYTFKIKNPKTTFGGAYIDKFIWKIQDFDKNNKEKIIEFKKKADLADLENSSKVFYEFKKPGNHKIYLQVIDSDGEVHNIKPITINIGKRVKLRTKLRFKVEGNEIRPFYESKDNIYFLEGIKSPTILKVDASKVRSMNVKYWLDKVFWDLNGDGEFEKFGKKLDYNVYSAGIKSFKVKYQFRNRKNLNEVLELVETINLSSIDKDAILDLKISMPNSYVPVIVSFDASKSKVTGKNIDKFIFNYGDGTKPEERDAKNTGHKYIAPGEYNVRLTVVTDDGIKYFITKKIVLKKRAQKAIITMSMKRAPVFQPIDFSSVKSIGEVAEYYWDFGDGQYSNEPSPSHFYRKPGKYKVKLKLVYTNRNVQEDEKEINIYEE